MIDPAFQKDGTYGCGESPMAGVDLYRNESTRVDYFDAVAGGLDGRPNMPGLNCNPVAEFGALHQSQIPYSRSSQGGTSGGYHESAPAYRPAYVPQTAKVATQDGESTVFHSGAAALGAVTDRQIYISEFFSAEERVKLFATFIEDPRVAKKVNEILTSATKKYACGEITTKDFQTAVSFGAYIYSKKKENSGK